LKEKLKHYGVENVEDLTLVEDSNNLGMNRGFAFLEFSSRSDAMNAFKRLQKRDVLFGVDRPAKVSFADSFIGPGDEIMAQVNIYSTDMLKIYISSKTVSTVSSTLYAAIFGAVYLVSSYCICP
jgi:RNA recognition motif-containing protein